MLSLEVWVNPIYSQYIKDFKINLLIRSNLITIIISYGVNIFFTFNFKKKFKLPFLNYRCFFLIIIIDILYKS